MSAIGNAVRTVFGNALNAGREASGLAVQSQAFGIESTELENALDGMRGNLPQNHMRRANDGEKAAGGIG